MGRGYRLAGLQVFHGCISVRFNHVVAFIYSFGLIHLSAVSLSSDALFLFHYEPHRWQNLIAVKSHSTAAISTVFVFFNSRNTWHISQPANYEPGEDLMCWLSILKRVLIRIHLIKALFIQLEFSPSLESQRRRGAEWTNRGGTESLSNRWWRIGVGDNVFKCLLFAHWDGETEFGVEPL